jgi:hypothetical protein
MPYTLSRPKASDLCVANNWGPGTVLISKAWKAPRKIHGPVRKADIHICVMILREDGTRLREEYLQTLPKDVAQREGAVAS